LVAERDYQGANGETGPSLWPVIYFKTKEFLDWKAKREAHSSKAVTAFVNSQEETIHALVGGPVVRQLTESMALLSGFSTRAFIWFPYPNTAIVFNFNSTRGPASSAGSIFLVSDIQGGCHEY
jgi:hypothetical protein